MKRRTFAKTVLFGTAVRPERRWSSITNARSRTISKGLACV